ncbi:Panacea domain-containing protein [Fibrobacter sp.]|uniref:Panacea domain-containing protein n=1 Tax=Fibrobacter sp. TaxID=35828 RepID=UPI00388F6815
MAYKAIQIAQLLLSKAAESKQELMSNLKLQKMLYYEQGFHLAAFGTPLFEEDIEAWMYGPVVPDVYNLYAKYEACGIEPPEKIDLELSEEETILFNNVFDVYNQYSATKLVEMTHNEPPWSNVTPGRGNIISQESMKAFFQTRLA